ncbi:glycoside hydrolase family 88 protein [Pelagicoccus sp. SDUM812003]|uniref:glycoside hydrolase family 88 protein n=1 Tax=Pelagicoccus sp. SDUM812003 TaxID=3041267 RepID=UPI00280FFC4C|nr:glycoside hydrolase family 88 protein [Pelagicoccus sp. SDUM812003]MDQ8201840.1 glycoside hydrolase family 88 protein [Pelagicoccus sp. SDUM812003]
MDLKKCVFATTALFALCSFANAAPDLKRQQVEKTLLKTADWHLENPVEWLGIRWWHQAPYYDGLLALSNATGDPKYLAHVIDYGERAGWTLSNRPYHADDHAVGHAWLDIYMMDTDKAYRMQPSQNVLDFVVANPLQEERWFGEGEWDDRIVDRWTWCDALYMSPPTLARLWKITGDEKYLRFMDYEYRVTYDELWDPEEKLFFRDSRFIDQRTERGKKIFWSRGNGWVYGGLALLLDVLPEDDLSYPFYENLFLEMTEGVVAAQQPDGLWRPSLRDPQQVKTGEASGTGFFVYGLAWGINRGLLDRETYWPNVVNGWNGLKTRIQSSGMVGYVQPVGFDPRDNISAEDTQAYGAGAVLLAGSEILKALGAKPKKTISELYGEAQKIVDSGKLNRPVGAYIVPRRADDVAWENDKIAFRAYGPALRESTEDSGIDVWTKRVSEPIVRKWYEMEFAGEGSYHQDSGEGYDAFKVGASRGCGGTGVWFRGDFYTANVYKAVHVKNTEPGYLSLSLEYEYDIDGRNLREFKTIYLEEGSYLCQARSHFQGDEEVLDEMEVSVGLVAQAQNASITTGGEALSLWDSMDGYWLATGVRLISGYEAGSVRYQKQATEHGDSLLTAKLDGRDLEFAFGFAWERHSDFENAEDWHDYLKTFETSENARVAINGGP